MYRLKLPARANALSALELLRQAALIRFPGSRSLALSILFLMVTAFAAGTQAQVTVTAPTMTVLPGSSIEAPVTIPNTVGQNILSYEFDFNYNTAVMTPQANVIETSGTLSSGRLVTFNEDTPGHILVSVFGATAINGPGTLFKFEFTAIGGVGTSSALDFNAFKFNEGIPDDVEIDGLINIDIPHIQFASAGSVDDESQTAMVAVTRTGFLGAAVGATFNTVAGGTATPGATCTASADYQSVTAFNVAFALNETIKFVPVPLCSDILTDPNKTVNMALSAPTGGADLGAQVSSVLTINDTANQYKNAANIDINTGGAATLYPSPITVSGSPVVLGSLRVTLYDVNHPTPDNMDVLLVGPGNRRYILMADAGGSAPMTAGTTLTFSDSAGAILPDAGLITTGTYEPTSWEPGQADFPGPAPVGPYNEPGSALGGIGTQTMLGNYGLMNPNGVWNLYIRDDNGAFAPLAVGAVAGGWGMEILIPTAASASLAGRVMTAEGQPIRNVGVTIEGGSLNGRRYALTNGLGYYSFDDLTAGESYVISVNSKRFIFPIPSRVITLNDSVADADFVADPIKEQ